MLRTMCCAVASALFFSASFGQLTATGAVVTFTSVANDGFATTDTNSCAIGVDNLVTATVGSTTFQFIGYYNASGEIMIGRRTPGSSTWSTFDSGINDLGSTSDDHDVIALAVDGNGAMHVSWGMHNIALNYSVSNASVMAANLSSISFTSKASSVKGSLASTTIDQVTYPQFYNIPGTGNLLFTYRDTDGTSGGSGNGNQYFVTYNSATQSFTDKQIVNGEATSVNAYLNRLVYTPGGTLESTWTWRATPNWQTNSNIMFGQSPDNGATWFQQNGSTQYTLPIIQSGSPAAARAQVVWTLPQNTSFINQTDMTLDKNNRPLVATYWAPGTTGSTNATQAVSSSNNPNRQYMLVYYDGTQWRTSQVSHRTSDTAFDTSGNDVRDLGRPLVMVDKQNRVLVVTRFEDTSLGSFSNPNLGLNKNNLVVFYNEDLMTGNIISDADWKSVVLDSAQLGSYEPTYDSTLWASSNLLDLFYQPMGLGQTSSAVKVLEWNEQAFFGVPEPASAVLMALGGLAFALHAGRRLKAGRRLNYQ
jgi:hypothetical protein